jgi:putative SOS response-associated peptidase YedK
MAFTKRTATTTDHALGFDPYWAKDPAIENRTINAARAKTLTGRPAFKHLVGSRRCIIPADGFYEWRKEGRRTVPMWIYLKGREPFGLVDLWDVWRLEDEEQWLDVSRTSFANRLPQS